MMPITPSGMRTRWILKPFGRSHSATVVPIGSASATTSATLRAIDSMEHRVAPSEAEDAFDLRGLAPHDLGGIAVRIGDDAARDFGALRGQHTYRVAAIESATSPNHTGGQQALAFEQRAQRSGID